MSPTAPAEAVEQGALYSRLSDLADPTRTRVLAVIGRAAFTVAELTEVLELPQSTISRHLRVLVDGGWVTTRRDGARRYYSLAVDGDGAQAELWNLQHREFSATSTCAADRKGAERTLEGRRGRSREFFDRHVDQWDSVRAKIFGSNVELAAALALLDRSWTVADLGCGTGKMTAAVAPFVHRVVAVDASTAMCAATRERTATCANVDVRRGELESLPVDDESIDVGLLSLVLHHVADPALVLAEAARVLRPHARLLVVDMQPHELRDLSRKLGHVWSGFEAEQLREWGEAAGFEQLDTYPLPARQDVDGPPLFLWMARRRGEPT